MTAQHFLRLVHAAEARLLQEERAQRRQETDCWFLVTLRDAHDLSLGRVPDGIKSMAEMVGEPTQVQLHRNARRKARA